MKIIQSLLILALAAGFLGAAEAEKIVVDGSTTLGLSAAPST